MEAKKKAGSPVPAGPRVMTLFAHPRSIVIAIGTGIVMGVALSKSQVFRPDVIHGQLTMSNFIMVKMFLSAAITSIIGVQIMVGNKWIKISEAPRSDWMRNLVGGFVLGCGMHIASACPGTVFAQFGPGIASAPYTLLGGLLGALVFGVLEPKVVPFIQKLAPSLSTPSFPSSIDTIAKLPRRVAAAATAAAFAVVLVALEFGVSSWRREAGVPDNQKSFGIFEPVWSPYAGGLVIGLLQFPSFLLMNHGLGCSSGFVVAAGCAINNLADRVSYFKNQFANMSLSTWQLFLDVGIVLGSVIAASALSLQPLSPAALLGVPKDKALLGGFLLIFGARIAGGCTSGHGLTGIARMNVGSLFAVMTMFGGGMLSALLF